MESLPYYVDENRIDARFAELEELEDKYTKVSLNGNSSTEASGIPIYCDLKKSYLLTDNSDTNTITVSSTGTGKSRRVLMPQLMSIALEGQSSVVVHDPKAELYKYTHELYENMGYKVIVLNFREHMSGDRFNPLEYIAKLYQKNKAKAIEMYQSFATTIFCSIRSEKDPFWEISAGRYFVGLAIIASQIYQAEDVTLYNIYNIHIYGNEKCRGSTYLKELCKMKQIDEMAYKFISVATETAADTQGGIYSIFDSMMSAYTMNMDIVDMTTNSTFDIDDIIKEKTIIYMITRDESKIFDNLVASMVDQFYQRLVDASVEYDGILPRRIEFVLDELSNMSRLNDIERKISASRSRNIRWNLCVQSLEQLAIIYGEDVAKVIISNCNNILYLYSPDMELLKLLSLRCGNRRDEYTGMSEPLVSVERLGHLKMGQCLMLLGRCLPFVTYLPDISEYPMVEEKPFNLKQRQRQKQTKLDVRKIVAEYNDKQLLEMQTPGFQGGISTKGIEGTLDINQMIAEIDRRIEEMDKEEEKMGLEADQHSDLIIAFQELFETEEYILLDDIE